MDIEFEHDGKKYLVKKTALFIFHELLPGRNTPARLFAVPMDETSTVKMFIEELENRKAQRRSALRGTFSLSS